MEVEEAAVDIWPERMDAADAEAQRIETAVEFWSGMAVEVEETMLSLETSVDTCVG